VKNNVFIEHSSIKIDSSKVQKQDFEKGSNAKHNFMDIFFSVQEREFEDV